MQETSGLCTPASARRPARPARPSQPGPTMDTPHLFLHLGVEAADLVQQPLPLRLRRNAPKGVLEEDQRRNTSRAQGHAEKQLCDSAAHLALGRQRRRLLPSGRGGRRHALQAGRLGGNLLLQGGEQRRGGVVAERCSSLLPSQPPSKQTSPAHTAHLHTAVAPLHLAGGRLQLRDACLGGRRGGALRRQRLLLARRRRLEGLHLVQKVLPAFQHLSTRQRVSAAGGRWSRALERAGGAPGACRGGGRSWSRRRQAHSAAALQ